MEYTKKQTCTRCIMDTRVPGITFDKEGVCNYCYLHKTLEEAFPLGETGQKIFSDIVAKVKEDGKKKRYDCVIGVSGGTDSSFLLYKAKELGLRPIASHFDSTWNSAIATENIRKLTKKLSIDLDTYVVDNKEMDDILLSFLKASIPWADSPTDMAITCANYMTAEKYGLKYVFVGNDFRTEGKQPIEWAYCDGKMVKAIHRRFGKKRMVTFPNLSLLKFVRYSILHGIKLIRPFNYIDYRKSDARELLQKNFGWEYYGGHHHECIFTRFVAGYLIPTKFKVDQRLVSLSALARSGEITRQEAIDIMQEPPYEKDDVEKDVEFVMKRFNLTRDEFENIMASPPKCYLDYPSYYQIFNKMKPVMKIAMKYALSWTPPMFYEMEMRDKK
jgi:N-acetyl sugar amidotransferase